MADWATTRCSRVEHLTMRFGGLVAIGDLSFTVGRNDITALIGPNGAGKTTVFNCLTGFYKPTEGMIMMRHDDGRNSSSSAWMISASRNAPRWRAPSRTSASSPA